MGKKIAVEVDGALLAFVEAQAEKIGQPPGAYLKMLVRGVQLIHEENDLTLIGLLLPVDQLRALLGGGAPVATSPPPARPSTHTSQIDQALDDYT